MPVSFYRIFILCLILFCGIFRAGHLNAQMLTGYGDEHKQLETEARSAEPLENFESPGTPRPRGPAYEPPPVSGKRDTHPEQEDAAPKRSLTATQRYLQAAKKKVRRAEEKAESQPVDLTADQLDYDDARETITASGNVRLVQDSQTLLADKVSYDLKTDTVTAEGNIKFEDANGNVYYAQLLELEDKMSRGVVSELRTQLAAGGRLEADKARRDGKKIVLTNATYTPCDCPEDEKMGWQIKGEEVTYDEEAHRVSYKNAQFEILGIPVLWSPFLAHPDGQIEQKSGLLPPSAGYDSQLGAVVTSQYYWAIAPDRDLTTGVMLTTEEAPVALAEYRQRFKDAAIEVNGSATYSSRPDRVRGQEVTRGEELRGHLFAEGRWDMNEHWRSGVNLEIASDDQYLRQYDFSDKDVLENEVFAERFSGRNYAVGRILSFQDVRLREERLDQPNIFPEINLSLRGDPNNVLGGRWGADVGFLQLERVSDDQDVTRLTGEVDWYRRYVTGFGLVNTLESSVRGDIYHVRDREIAAPGSGLSTEGYETRFYPRAHLVSSYPLVRDFDRVQAIVEPMAALTVSRDIDSDDLNIPNEDSQDVQIDTSNLFNASRFPGKDRIEDKNHVTYGVRSGLYDYDGNYLNVMVGQSYRFDEDNNPFPAGSGLSRQNSDFVGEVRGLYQDRYGLDYRFQIDSDELSSQRHELDGFMAWDDFRFNTRYLFAKALEGTDIDQSREQIENSFAYDFVENWRLRAGALHDLGEDPGLRKALLGLDYFGCCLSFSVTAERTLTQDSAGDSNTEVTFRLGLKGLGEFESGGASLGP